MRILVDENVSAYLVAALRRAGLAVSTVAELKPAASDPSVLALAAEIGALLLTHDKDFGGLKTSIELPAGCGVILLRVRPGPSPEANDAVAALVAGETGWAGKFSVIEPGRVRMRPLA